MKTAILSVVLGLFAHAACADDLFVDRKPIAFTKQARLEASSTIGGYPIYQGDGGWRLVELVNGESNAISFYAESIQRGSVALYQTTAEGQDFAYMRLWVNLATTAVNQYMVGSPCAGPHMVVVNKISGRDDNCLTIDVAKPQPGDTGVKYFWISVTQNRSAGRTYYMALRLNAGVLGWANTAPEDWSPEAISTSPSRKVFVDNLQRWAVLLQQGAERAVDFSKPADAFSQALPLSALLPVVQGKS